MEEINKEHMLETCAHCGEKNELNEDGKAIYCIHCGYSLLNHCTNYNDCGKTIPPSAAYCPYCGSESHFLKSKLLDSKRKIQIDDDDLPF